MSFLKLMFNLMLTNKCYWTANDHKSTHSRLRNDSRHYVVNSAAHFYSDD